MAEDTWASRTRELLLLHISVYRNFRFLIRSTSSPVSQNIRKICCLEILISYIYGKLARCLSMCCKYDVSNIHGTFCSSNPYHDKLNVPFTDSVDTVRFLVDYSSRPTKDARLQIFIFRPRRNFSFDTGYSRVRVRIRLQSLVCQDSSSRNVASADKA